MTATDQITSRGDEIVQLLLTQPYPHDPYPLYARAARPRARVPVVHRANGCVTTYDAVSTMFRSASFGQGEAVNLVRHDPRFEWSAVLQSLGQMMVFMDPPDHTRLRRIVSRTFNPRVIEELRPYVQQVVDDLLGAARRRWRRRPRHAVQRPHPRHRDLRAVGRAPRRPRAVPRVERGDRARHRARGARRVHAPCRRRHARVPGVLRRPHRGEASAADRRPADVADPRRGRRRSARQRRARRDGARCCSARGSRPRATASPAASSRCSRIPTSSRSCVPIRHSTRRWPTRCCASCRRTRPRSHASRSTTSTCAARSSRRAR